MRPSRPTPLRDGPSSLVNSQCLGYEDVLPYNRLSDYELGKRVPPLPVVLEYARVASIHLEDIVDDELGLPARLPGDVKYKGIKSKSAFRKRR